MTTTPSVNQSTGKADPTGGISLKVLIIRFTILLALPAIILFGTSGRLDWWMAWAYIVMAVVLTVASRIVMLRKNPDLAAERARALDKEDSKSWDRIIVPIVAIFGPVIMLIVAGLDMRNDWSPEIANWVQIAAFVVVLAGYSLGYWATDVNRFFSATVRIQKDRGHTVISSGPYRFVRHPGYVAGIVANVAMPVMLDSLWALVPAVLVIVLTVIRTALEDRTLQAELDGYKDYTQRVRYRLLPGVW